MGLWVDQNREENTLPIAAETAKLLRNLISPDGKVKDRELDQAISSDRRKLKPGRSDMTTSQLIAQAQADTATKSADDTALAAAQAADTAAGAAVVTDSQAVHDDLATNGQALVIVVNADGTSSYQVATAVDPGSFALTPIRVA